MRRILHKASATCWNRTSLVRLSQSVRHSHERTPADLHQTVRPGAAYHNPQEEADGTMDRDVAEAHRLLGTHIDDSLATIKLRYLLWARKTHPELPGGGDPALFYKLTLAYERIIYDRGIECRDGELVYTDTVKHRRLPRNDWVFLPKPGPQVEQITESSTKIDENGTRTPSVGASRQEVSSSETTKAEATSPSGSEVTVDKKEDPLESTKQEHQSTSTVAGTKEEQAAAEEATSSKESSNFASTSPHHSTPANQMVSPAIVDSLAELEKAERDLIASLPLGQRNLIAEERLKQKYKFGLPPDAVHMSMPQKPPLSDATWDKIVFTRVAGATPSPDFLSALTNKDEVEAKKGVIEHQPLPYNYEVENKDLVMVDETGKEVAPRRPEERWLDGEANRHQRLLDSEDPADALLRPRTAFFDQRELMVLSDAEVKELWMEAPKNMTHDEEEAVAREMIERQIEKGELDTGFMMAHLVDRSESVAGEAARTASDWMWSTQDRKQLDGEIMMLRFLIFSILLFGVYLLFRYKWLKKKLLQRPDLDESMLDPSTMLPYWGNDAQYEAAVKRIFIDEFKKTRSAALRSAKFQGGLKRESMKFSGQEEDARQLDLKIFEVTDEHLDEIRKHAEGRRKRRDRSL